MIYIIMCFLTRSLESVASAAASTANMAIATYTFPRHVSTVIVSTCTVLSQIKRLADIHRGVHVWRPLFGFESISKLSNSFILYVALCYTTRDKLYQLLHIRSIFVHSQNATFDNDNDP